MISCNNLMLLPSACKSFQKFGHLDELSLTILSEDSTAFRHITLHDAFKQFLNNCTLPASLASQCIKLNIHLNVKAVDGDLQENQLMHRHDPVPHSSCNNMNNYLGAHLRTWFVVWSRKLSQSQSKYYYDYLTPAKNGVIMIGGNKLFIHSCSNEYINEGMKEIS